MQVNASKRQLVIALLAAVVALLGIVACVLRQYAVSKHFVDVEATVELVTSTLNRGYESNTSPRLYHYVKVSYQVQGKKCESQFRTLWPGQFHAGDTVKLRADPNIPGKIRDPFALKLEFAAIAFLAVFALLDMKAIRMV